MRYTCPFRCLSFRVTVTILGVIIVGYCFNYTHLSPNMLHRVPRKPVSQSPGVRINVPTAPGVPTNVPATPGVQINFPTATGGSINVPTATGGPINVPTTPGGSINVPPPGFLVKTSSCSIPDIDPWEGIVRKGGIINCPTTPNLVKVDKTKLVVDYNVAKKYYNGSVDYCQYTNITRPFVAKDGISKLSDPSPPFKTEVRINVDYIRVTCFGSNRTQLYRNYHGFIKRKPDIEKTKRPLFKKHKANVPGEKLNVILMVIDNISRLNFIRQMPETRKFLRETLKAVELFGYNKVADNTFPNLATVFKGKFVEEFPWNETLSQIPFDNYTFIWNEFAAKGYRTFFAEDYPKAATFNYLKGGFHRQPTDYYLRPFTLAMERDKTPKLWTNAHYCIGNKFENKVYLDLLKNYMGEFRSDPYFAYIMHGRLAHGNAGRAAATDQHHLQFFKECHKKHLLNNTAVFFFSDHGARFGKIRKTYIGKLEERLPFMNILLPQWFLKKYPDITNNLRSNVYRLTTPFDIYYTMKNILNFDGTPKPQASVKLRGNTLFDLIPEERSCEDAGVLPHWCSCQRHVKISNDDPRAVESADVALNKINELLKPHPQCAQLNVSKMHDARQTTANDKVLDFSHQNGDVLNRTFFYGNRSSSIFYYLITFYVLPSNGLLEATVRFTEKSEKFDLQGEPSRLDMYGNQSSCLDNFNLQKYCYCNVTKD